MIYLLSRDEFREAVFKRDGYKCIFCGKTASDTLEGKLDAHHIIERRLFSDGGYYIDNGATVCEEHHLQCEMTIISVEDVREACGITKIVVPDQFYPEQPIDKWGNYILEDGRRTKGELFNDESVQKILSKGGVLGKFTQYVKYGRTFHLPFSPGIHDDDKAIKDCSQFEGQDVIVSLKKDGENTTMYSDYIHARSIDSRGGEDRAWVKNFWSSIAHDIPIGWRICGENIWAKHSIGYNNLSSYFYGFSIWTDKNICLSWDDTLEYFNLLGIIPVEVIYSGSWNENLIKKIANSLDTRLEEGIVVRKAASFSYGEFKNSIAKWVRKDHVQTTTHWRAGQQIVKNSLRK